MGVAQVVQLVEPAGALVDEDRVPVTGRAWTSFDVDVPRDRIADAVGLGCVPEGDSRAVRLPRDDVERDPDRPADPCARAEIGVNRGVQADRTDELGGIGRYWKLVDSLAQQLVREKVLEADQIRATLSP